MENNMIEINLLKQLLNDFSENMKYIVMILRKKYY